MYNEDMKREIQKAKKQWEEKVLSPANKRFGMEKSPTEIYTPLDLKDFEYLRDVGFPGQYPFTGSTYPSNIVGTGMRMMARGGGEMLRRAAMYSGYGTPEDTRDYYKGEISRGLTGGPNLALDLPTQCGYDSDNPIVEGEVGKVGVTIDTLRDFEVIFEPFVGSREIDKVATNITINAPANILVSMYLALADKREISWDKLRSTPQNDILKEFVSRGTYVFPPRPSMRMFRDSLVFFTENCPGINITSIGGYHIREAGATREQDLAYSMAIGIAYLQEGVNAGLDIDSFAPRFTFNAFGGSMEFFKEIAFHRAARKMWANIIKERFKAKKPESMRIRVPFTAMMGCSSSTKIRALNNLTRAAIGGIAGALSGGPPAAGPPYDEPLGLGWSREAKQLMMDAVRIMVLEAKLCDVIDPLAGSYYIESLTKEIEEAAWEELKKIEDMGGAVTAIENGYMQREVAKSAADRQRRIEAGDELIVGVNCFTGENELDVTTSKIVDYPYDPEKRERAEEKQKAALAEIKRTRDNNEVSRLLKELKSVAKDESKNLFPIFIDCAKAYVTEQEQCDVLREIFGEWKLDTFV
ncbi:MAG: methylmalonyl-CoA mutase family protein [Thermodesulfobacteriota bacterium]|nr:methylmalonyl-CoA mutase family protein [Thermodesulfobacteriota bacterium]